VNNITSITNSDKAEAIAQQFALNHQNPLANHSPAFTNHVAREVSYFFTRPPTRSTTNIEPDLTSIEEVHSLIKRLPNNKAPGRDKIDNRLLKNLPSNGLIFLCALLNACLRLSHFPECWRHADVIPICKPQKDSSDPQSYRPISLLSSMSKLLEKLVQCRLASHTNDINLIPPIQHGFRSGYSTVHQLKRVIGHARANLAQRCSTGIVTLDCEKAFDRIWHDGLLFKLIKNKYPKYLITLIRSFLTNRSFRVVINGQPSGSHPIPFGLPQGAVMSPDLTNVYTHDLPTSRDHQTAMFADDVAKFSSSKSFKTIHNKLSKAAKSTHRYMNKWKIQVNGAKTNALFITKRTRQQIPQGPIHIFDAGVEWSDSIKYLGVNLDRRLTFSKHIEYVTNRANQAIRILYPLLCRKSKLCVANKIIIYKLAIRPILTYASPSIKGIAKSHLKKMQITQNKALKMILNRAWFTPTHEIHSTANIPMIHQYINKLTEKFEERERNQ
jgi:hypothetical protein